MDETFSKVENAIRGVKKGEVKEYNCLITFLSDPNVTEELFNKHIKALKQNILLMKKEHETLIGVILNVDWMKLSQTSIDFLIEFMIELISAKAYYLKVCIKSLIKHFSLKSEVIGDELDHLKIQLEKVHYSLKTIITLAPLSSKYITENVNKCFPYIGKKLFILETFLMNVLQITTYCPHIRYEILSLCIDKMMSIDVRIPRKEFEDRSDDETEFQFDADLEQNNAPVEKPVNENVAKLDQLMMITLTYIHSLCHNELGLDLNQAEIFFSELLHIFVEVIMKTQQSLHVQFVLLYAASFHSKFSTAFIDSCWKIIEDPNVASILRQAAAGYLSSFLARAKYITNDSVKSQLSRLSSWIHRYIDLQDGSTLSADFDKHGPFYSTCQALFYVFIYHHKQLLSSKKELMFVKSLNFMRIITSKLNPLKYCLNTVVNMFARLARMYEIVFCYSVIERNNRNTLSELTFSANDVIVKSTHMEMFFPFDPYMLPRSKEFIKPLYLEWSGSVIDDHSDCSDDEDTSEMFSDLNDEKFHVANVVGSFDMMCVSPGFSLVHHES